MKGSETILLIQAFCLQHYKSYSQLILSCFLLQDDQALKVAEHLYFSWLVA